MLTAHHKLTMAVATYESKKMLSPMVKMFENRKILTRDWRAYYTNNARLFRHLYAKFLYTRQVSFVGKLHTSDVSIDIDTDVAFSTQ